MKLVVIVFFLLSPFSSSAQNMQFDDVFNLYRRNADVIKGYIYDYLASEVKYNGEIDTTNEGIVLKHMTFIRYDKNKCYDSLYVYGDVELMARENRARIVFTNIQYTIYGFTGECPTTGNVIKLKECKECHLDDLLIRDRIATKFIWMRDNFKSFAAKKASKDKDNW